MLLKLHLFISSSPFQEQHKNLQASKDHLSLKLQDHTNALVSAQVTHSHDHCFKFVCLMLEVNHILPLQHLYQMQKKTRYNLLLGIPILEAIAHWVRNFRIRFSVF